MINRKYKIAGLALLLCFLLQITALAYPNEKNGFRGLEWGTKFETVQDQMIPWGSDTPNSRSNFFTRKNEDLTLGSAKLTSVVYLFMYKQLTAVCIDTNHVNMYRLKEVLQANFGGGVRDNTYTDDGERWLWNGDITNIDFSFSRDKEFGGGMLWLRSNKLYGSLQQQMIKEDADKKLEIDKSAKF
jgi:hypothetical protein